MSSDGLIFRYGNYQHLPGEVKPRFIRRTPEYSQDGLRWCDREVMVGEGHFVNVRPELDTDGVDARILEMDNAYKLNYQNWAFYKGAYNAGDPTENRTNHYRLNADSIGGNQVVWRSWDDSTLEELANTRSFSFAIQALVANIDQNEIFFQEYSERIGDGGPVWKLYNDWTGQPIQEQIFAQSKIRHIQSGTIIRMDTWATPPAPYWPTEEQSWKQRVRQTTPKIWGLNGVQTHFRLDYTYYFERIEDTGGGSPGG